MQSETDLFSYKSYSSIDFIIGLFITLGASIVNALGLNITKLDFTRQELLPAAQRTRASTRLLWWLGLGLYIASQVVGSTLALEYLRAEWVAPLGSTSLIFNFIFAYLLVGTSIVRSDIYGTLTIVVGVVGVVVFSNLRLPSLPGSFDAESNLSLSLLKTIWGRSDWIVYLLCLEVFTVAAFWMSEIGHEVCAARVEDEREEGGGRTDVDEMVAGGRRAPFEASFVGRVRWGIRRTSELHGRARAGAKRFIERWAQSKDDTTIRKAAGLSWSITGGVLAGQTLVLAKSAVKLVTSAINNSDPTESSPFTSPLTWLIIILLVSAAVSQVYCLNASLKCYESTFCVPVFFAAYTISGFLNSLVYLDELKSYSLPIFLAIWASIAVLIGGVGLLSFKKPPPRPKAATEYALEGETPRSENADPFAGEPEGEGEVEKSKGQGVLGKFLGRGAGASGAGEASRKERRGRKGVQRLGEDGDSVLEMQVGRAEEIEMDEVDRLGMESEGEESEDDFGEFEDAEEGEEKKGKAEV